MKNIYILGAAGSIGLQALKIIRNDSVNFSLIGISLGSNDLVNHDILSNHFPKLVCLRHESQVEVYQKEYPDITFFHGDLGLLKLASYPKKGILLNALSGSAGLLPTVEAIKSGKDIALANKETLVMAGPIIKQLLKKYKVDLFPVDSEHSAIWQIIQNENFDDIDQIVITASGGSFRHLNRKSIEKVSVSEALTHPNWQMGAKITIDSATMMNKGLEVIEAHYLFDMDYNRIQTVLHDESLCHGLVYFKDGTIKASFSDSDMKIPIGYALYYPNRLKNYPSEMKLSHMSFKPMDDMRFPLIKLAYEVGKKGGLLPTVMNAANEMAVKLFLKGKISFLEIEEIIFDYVETFANQDDPSLELIITTDQSVQQEIKLKYETR